MQTEERHNFHSSAARFHHFVTSTTKIHPKIRRLVMSTDLYCRNPVISILIILIQRLNFPISDFLHPILFSTLFARASPFRTCPSRLTTPSPAQKSFIGQENPTKPHLCIGRLDVFWILWIGKLKILFWV